MQAKSVSPEIEQAFTGLLKLAKEAVNSMAADGMWQAVVCQTTAGNTHVFFMNYDDQATQATCEEKILNTFVTQKDTAIAFLVAMWRDQWIDLPSYDLRRKLIDLDGSNREALLVLQGENCLVVRTIGSTMPA